MWDRRSAGGHRPAGAHHRSGRGRTPAHRSASTQPRNSSDPSYSGNQRSQVQTALGRVSPGEFRQPTPLDLQPSVYLPVTLNSLRVRTAVVPPGSRRAEVMAGPVAAAFADGRPGAIGPADPPPVPDAPRDPSPQPPA